VENLGFGVTANAIALSLMEILDPPRSRLSLADRIPVGRMSDVGSLCAYLATVEAA
jgi:hypothetical protein